MMSGSKLFGIGQKVRYRIPSIPVSLGNKNPKTVWEVIRITRSDPKRDLLFMIRDNLGNLEEANSMDLEWYEEINE